MDDFPLDRIALMLIRQRRIALALAPEDRWPDLYGQRMLRLEFPSVIPRPGFAASEQALAICRDVFGCGASLVPTAWTYGPSPRHAIDRQPAAAPAAPFLRYSRLSPPEDAADHTPRPIAIALYRAAPADALAPDPRMTAGALWLPLAALRTLVRGVRVTEALALEGVKARLAARVALPEDGFIYLPADVGERMLPRIAAKYGERALFVAPEADA